MVRWHHQLNRHESEQALGVGDGQGSLACCSPWDRKESDTTEWLNWTGWFSLSKRLVNPLANAIFFSLTISENKQNLSFAVLCSQHPQCCLKHQAAFTAFDDGVWSSLVEPRAKIRKMIRFEDKITFKVSERKKVKSGSVSCSVVSSSLRPMDCSPPGSSVHGVLHTRILEWAAIPFSK